MFYVTDIYIKSKIKDMWYIAFLTRPRIKVVAARDCQPIKETML